MYRSCRNSNLLVRRASFAKKCLSILSESTNTTATASTLTTNNIKFNIPKTNNQIHNLTSISSNRNRYFQKQSFHSTKSNSATFRTDESSIITGLKALSIISPKNVVAAIEKGWQKPSYLSHYDKNR